MLDMVELTAIASEPTCTYLILLGSGFTELDSIVNVVQKMACEGKRIQGRNRADCVRVEWTLVCHFRVKPILV